MIPNMARVIRRKSLPFIYVKVIVFEGGFEDTVDPIESDIKGVIQIPQDKTLIALNLDLSISYRQIHITTEEGIIPAIGDQVKYKNKNHKVIRFRDFEEYGYYEFIVEEILNGSY